MSDFACGKMTVVILAAGKGSRLEKGQDQPKTLTVLSNGLTILDMQLKTLSTYFPPSSIRVVVGFQKEAIISRYPHVTYVENQDYATENTSKSLLKAIQNVDSDLLWLNGDVVFHSSILAPFLQQCKTSMVVNCGEVGAEEVKYKTDGQGNIVEVSKSVKEAEAEGEALGINFFKKKDLKELKNQLEKCNKSDYFEKAIELCIKKGVLVSTFPVDSSCCTEIDFFEDLQKANKLISNWK